MSDDEDILAVAQSIADAAAEAEPGLRPYPTLRDALTVPAIVVTAGEPFITYHQRFGGYDAAYAFDVVFLASKQNEVAAQRRLYSWASPRSAVFQAIDSIDGVAAEALVNVGNYDVGTATYWGGTLRVSYDG